MRGAVSIGRVAFPMGRVASAWGGRDRALRFYLRPARVGAGRGFLWKPRRPGYSGPEDSRCDHSRGRRAGWQVGISRMAFPTLVVLEIRLNIVYLTTRYTLTRFALNGRVTGYHEDSGNRLFHGKRRMVKSSYIPDRGDIVWLNFNSQLGHVQRDRRPALVLSHKSYNDKIGLGIFCPITSKEKAYPFEVKIIGKKIQGCVLSDQVKSLHWKVRETEFIERVDPELLQAVIDKIKVIIQ
jgi:mRNA interferase MazF